MASALVIAQYLESKPESFGRMQLLKLVYYSQAWALTWTGRPLFDEEIEAWDKGPVTPSVWRRHRAGTLEPGGATLADSEAAIVDAVFAHYGRINGTSLSRMTHAEPPWRDAWDDGRGRNSVIAKSAMRRAYTELAAINPRMAPRAPVLKSDADRDAVVHAVGIERDRWRSLLDQLAKE